MIFLDIGSTTISLNHVIAIHRTNLGNVLIEYDVLDGDGPAQITLHGEEAEAFKSFWENANFSNLMIFKVI